MTGPHSKDDYLLCSVQCFNSGLNTSIIHGSIYSETSGFSTVMGMHFTDILVGNYYHENNYS